MKGIFSAISEVARLIHSWSDPGKRRQAYKLHLDKRRNLALEAAEKYILANKELMATKDNKERKRLKKRLRVYEKRFFRWN
jgi:hypothetical protein